VKLEEVEIMASSVYKLFTATGLAPQATFHFLWNNVPAAGKACAVDAYGYNVGSTQEGFTNTTKIEVTHFVRRRRQIEKQGSIGVTVEVHDDIEGDVKNVGSSKLDFDLYLVVFS
jgi:hypothetical protein